jgi:glycosyltransferase involved in cell wall biosynthesis
MTAPLRLFFFGDASSPHVTRWTKWFANRGDAVWLATDSEPEERLDGVKVLKLGGAHLPSAARFTYRVSQARLWNRRFRPHIAHGHYVQHYGYLATRCGCPTSVVSVWGSDVLRLSERGPRHARWTQETLQAADLVTVDSEDLAARVVGFGASREAMMRVVLGPDLGRRRTADGIALRAELGIAGEHVVILSMRNLEPLYRPTAVARAMAAVSDRRADVRGVIVGEGSCRAEVAGIVASTGGRVLLLPRQSGNRVADFFAMADVFVSVPETDGTSVALLEAIASGAVPVVSDIPANREWVNDNSNGLIVSAQEGVPYVASLSRVLTHVASDHEERRRLRAAAVADPNVLAVTFDAEMVRVREAYAALAKSV